MSNPFGSEERSPFYKPSPIYENDPHGRFKEAGVATTENRDDTVIGRKSALLELYALSSSDKSSTITNASSKFIKVLQERPGNLRHVNMPKGTRKQKDNYDLESNSSRSAVRYRKPPQTQLEILGGYSTWLLIVFPWLFLLLSILLDYAVDSATPNLAVTQSNCPFPLSCQYTDVSMVITLIQPFILTQYMQLSIMKNDTVKMGFSLDELSNVLVSVLLSTTSPTLNHTFVQTTVGPFYSSEPSAETGAVTATFGLDQPGMYSNNKLLVLNLVCVGGTDEEAASVFSALVVNVGFNNTMISIFRACVVICLFFLTLYRLHRSYAQMGKYIKHMSDVTKVWLDIQMSFRLMLAEQIYSFMLLCWLLLWVNILNPICILMAVNQLEVPEAMLFSAGLLQKIGEQGLYFSVLVLFDGLRFTLGRSQDDLDNEDLLGGGKEKFCENSEKSDFLTGNVKYSANIYGPSWMQPPFTRAPNNSLSMSNRTQPKRMKYSSLPDSVHEFPGHHPFSPFYADFMLPKALYLLLACITISVIWVLKFPLLFCISSTVTEENVLACVEFFFFILTWLWIVFIIEVIVKSGIRLRRIPYMISRFRQMAYRLLMSQLSSGVVLTFVSLALSLYNFVILVNTNGSLYQTCVSLAQQLSNSWNLGIGSWIFSSDNQLGSGGTVYVASIAYTVAFIFVAPLPEYLDEGIAGGATHAFAILERDIPLPDAMPFHKLKPFSSSPCKSFFCLETACRLLECTWQSYFPPNKDLQDLDQADNLARMLGTDTSSLMDVADLNLIPKAYYHDKGTSTFGYLATNDEKRICVIAFRGTARYKNIETDFNLAQITLPTLKLTKRYFVNLLRAAKVSAHHFGFDHKDVKDDQEGILAGSDDDLNDDDEDNDDDADKEDVEEEQKKSKQETKKETLIFEKGDPAIYMESEECLIIEKHLDDLPHIYYTVQLRSDGRKKQTKIDHLKPIQINHDFIPVLTEEYRPINDSESPVRIDCAHSGSSKSQPPSARGSSGDRDTFAIPDSGVRFCCMCDMSNVKLPSMEIAQNALSLVFSDLVSAVPVARDALPRVHAGFWAAYVTVREEVLLSVTLAIAADVRNVLNQPPSKGSSDNLDNLPDDRAAYINDIVSSLEIQFCGHSLGGALAVLAALDVSSNLLAMVRAAIILTMPEIPLLKRGHDFYDVRALQASILPRLTLYTFGTPRIGNSVFVNLAETTIGCDHYFRVECDGDFIVQTPPAGYYYHAGTQVLIDSEGCGSIIVKPTIVESHLLGTSSWTGDSHSLHTYRQSLEACFEDCELREYLSKTSLSKDLSRNPSYDNDFPDWYIDRR